MQDLEITWPDGVERFSVADSPIHLGRSSQAAIPLTESSVSRRHLELAWNGTTWVAKDSSTHGTYDPIGVRLAPEWSLTTDTTVRLGGPEGVQVQIRPVGGPAVDIDLVSEIGIARPRPGANGAAKVPAMPGSIGPQVERLSAPVERPAGQSQAPPVPTAGQELEDRSKPGGLFAPVDRSQRGQPESRPPGDSLFPDRGAGRVERPLAEETPQTSGSAELRAPKQSAPPSPSHRSPARSKILSDAEPERTPGPDDNPAPDPPARSGGNGSSLLGPGPTGGFPAVSIDPNSTIISDSTLRLNVGGQDYSFVPGAEVTVGRDPSCLVQLDERHSLVSRRHLKLTFDDGHWWLEDFSSKGTFVNGQQLRKKKPYRADGAFVANLGDDDAGTPMRIITAGEHRAPHNRNTAAIAGLAAAALIPLIILAVLLTNNGSSSSEPDFATAKRSTVMLFGTDGGQGSGFMVSDDLILTNQHVAVLSPQMLVGVSRKADEPAQIEYATELVANHPFLDLAVLRISNPVTMTGDGPEISSEPVGDINLPSATIGDSTDVTIGDRVFNTGFPGRLSITSADDAGDLRLPSVVATSGEAANFAIWPGCSNPDFELFIPSDSPPGVACSAGGDLRNGVLLASFFSSGQGASGSAVYHENEVVAVVYAGAAEEDNATLSITTAVFGDWLSEIIEQNP